MSQVVPYKFGIHPALRKTMTLGQRRRPPSILHAGVTALSQAAEDRKERWKKPLAEVERIALMSTVAMVPGLGLIVGPDAIEHFVEQRHPGWKARATPMTVAHLTDGVQTQIADQFLARIQTQAQQMARRRGPAQSEARKWLTATQAKNSKLRENVRNKVVANLTVARAIHLSENPHRSVTGKTIYRSPFAKLRTV